MHKFQVLSQEVWRFVMCLDFANFSDSSYYGTIWWRAADACIALHWLVGKVLQNNKAPAGVM